MMLSSTALPALAGWESFYVITGSSSAGLIGLMFVVVSLVTDVKSAQNSDTLNAFATPSVVHFAAVLLIAAMLSTPGQTATSLAICMTVCGVAGLGYSARVIGRAVRQDDYEPVWEDWLWYMILPIAAYTTLLAAAVVMRRNPVLGLYLIGAIDLGLLFIGMHNAWDTATWVAIHFRPRAQASANAEASEPPV